MAQDKFKFNGVTIKTPTEYSASLATTSTSDSGRNQYLQMKNTVVGTVRSYSFKWRLLTPQEMSLILRQVLNKSSFTAHFFDIYAGAWMDGAFYASNFNAPVRRLIDGVEMWDELSFNIVGVNPI